MSMRPFSLRPKAAHYTLDEARQVARQYAELHRTPRSRDVAGFLNAKEAEEAAVRPAADEAAVVAERLAKQESRHTLWRCATGTLNTCAGAARHLGGHLRRRQCKAPKVRTPLAVVQT
jgi:hypothetical protein